MNRLIIILVDDVSDQEIDSMNYYITSQGYSYIEHIGSRTHDFINRCKGQCLVLDSADMTIYRMQRQFIEYLLNYDKNEYSSVKMFLRKLKIKGLFT